MSFPLKRSIALFLWLALAASCASPAAVSHPAGQPTAASKQPIVVTQPPTETAVPEPTQPVSPINPLTGLPVQYGGLLDLPAALVSISHFPPAARPQSGLSFAPFVFEIYITEGATRFLTTFYGQMPAPEPYYTGGCEVRNTPMPQAPILLGNRVWLDANHNDLEDAWEGGVGGVCLDLYAADGTLLQQTTTDSQGFYAFSVPAGSYVLRVNQPPDMTFSQPSAGEETQDSDVDPSSGRSEPVEVTARQFDLDAGLSPDEAAVPAAPLAQSLVGPVRSGRLVYADIASSFPGSCLIFAYASAEVLVELPTCAFVDHILQGGGYMLETARLQELVQARREPRTRALYATNLFSPELPAGGLPADRLEVYFAWLNQAAWAYDAASRSWWRYVDDADPAMAGVLHPEVDRLTNRQLQFENVIVLFTRHDVVSPTNLDIRLEYDRSGDALLFRDGQVFKIRWSTAAATPQDVKNGTQRPIRFLYPDDKTLFPLHPGHTWVSVVTPLTAVTERLPGRWLLQFSQPEGAK